MGRGVCNVRFGPVCETFHTLSRWWQQESQWWFLSFSCCVYLTIRLVTAVCFSLCIFVSDVRCLCRLVEETIPQHQACCPSHIILPQPVHPCVIRETKVLQGVAPLMCCIHPVWKFMLPRLLWILANSTCLSLDKSAKLAISRLPVILNASAVKFQNSQRLKDLLSWVTSGHSTVMKSVGSSFQIQWMFMDPKESLQVKDLKVERAVAESISAPLMGWERKFATPCSNTPWVFVTHG